MGALACRDTPAAPPLRRLDLGGPLEARTLDGDTRPAVRLHPGDTRVVELDLPRGGVLSLAVAAGGEALDAFAHLTLSVGGRVVLDTRRRPRPWPRWRSLRAELPAGRPLRLTFEVSVLGADGLPVTSPGGPAAYLDVSAPRVHAAGRERPARTLVWVSLDTVRADHLSLYGYARPTTPHLARRAADWVVFERAVAASSWTLPSMTSLFTARLPAFHGVADARNARRSDQTTLFEQLARSGFSVLGVSANRFVSARFNLAAGFDTLSFTPGDAAEVNRLALRALDDWPGGDRALFVHYMDPHVPYTPPAEFARRFGIDAGQGSGWPPAPGTSAAAHRVAELRARYDAELAYTDACVDTLLRALETRGWLRDAVVVLSADHGEELGERGGWGHGHTLHRELLEVPLALRAPGLAARRVATPVSLVDVAPTVAELLGVDRPATFLGHSLVALLHGGAAQTTSIVAETRRDPQHRHQVALRVGGLSYLALLPGQGGAPRDERVFDLARDPHELTPLVTHPALADLRRRLLSYAQGARSQGLAPETAALDAADHKALRALGYVE